MCEALLNHALLFLTASAQTADMLKEIMPSHDTVDAIIENIETTYRACSNLEKMLTTEIEKKFGS